ncbi:unnamed protein product [Dracunculus medinensis]|uniref:EB domain-containing protein n=1 Tax=Dracunculus medinensis TaxID=318479 RepID=A0A158Q392_DRAME|nr:unnamed protein product [Dracunculus medinensis]
MTVTTRNASIARNIWKAWRSSVGEGFADYYKKFIELTNKGAALNGFTSAGSMWRNQFENRSTRKSNNSASVNETFDLLNEIQRIYEQILPITKLFLNNIFSKDYCNNILTNKWLHAFVRWKLVAIYGLENVKEMNKDGPIPSHLLSKKIPRSLTGQRWTALYQDVKPFNKDENLSELVSDELRKKNYTAKKLFTQAYTFFKKLGFGKLPKNFWTDSVFERSWSKDMLCNPPNAYDMRNGIDYRIRACVQISETDFKLAHKLVAHLYYQYLYRDQPISFQDAPEETLLMAFADVFEMLAGDTGYLITLWSNFDSRLDLLPPKTAQFESLHINHLFNEALKDFVQLPFDLVADLWRFKIFDGKISIKDSNAEWWRLSEFYQGIKRIVMPESNDFDAIAIPSIAQTQWVTTRHFISYITKFQIRRSICSNSLRLNEGCQIDKKKVNVMRNVMSQGSAINWLEAIRSITGSNELDATPLLEYYEPLIVWLSNTIEAKGIYVGWDGPGIPFIESEIPQKTSNNSDLDLDPLLASDQVAYPGENCSDGQECILDSICMNGLCECKQGLYTLKIATTHNCVVGNPTDAGFGEMQGGLVIGLFPNDNASLSTPNITSEPEPEPISKLSARNSIWQKVSLRTPY